MNYLAHTFFSHEDAEELAGNFMTDFLKKKETHHFSDSVKTGIVLHQKIDQYTDSHPAVKEAISLLRPTQGKYTPVAIDVLFDYFLILNWEKYSVENIQTFTRKVYKMLGDTIHIFPPKLKELLPYMIEDDFLMSCKNEDRLKVTFSRISKRLKYENNFKLVHIDLQRHYQELDTHFNQFFPELLLYIDQNKQNRSL